VASENGRRTAGVVTYQDTNMADMVARLRYVTEHYFRGQVRGFPRRPGRQDRQDGGVRLQNHRAVV
jgi:hypothetical protein